MRDFIEKITKKTGISEDQAKKVWEFLKDNADDVVDWFGDSAVGDKAKDALGSLGKLF